MSNELYITRHALWHDARGPSIEQSDFDKALRTCTDKAWCIRNRLNGRRISTRLATPSIAERFTLIDGNVHASDDSDEVACLALDLAAELNALVQTPSGENLYYDLEKKIGRTHPGVAPPFPEKRFRDAAMRETPWKYRVITALGIGLLSFLFRMAYLDATREERSFDNQVRFLKESRYHLKNTPDYQEMVKKSVRAGLYSERALRLALSSEPEVLDMLLAELPDPGVDGNGP
ncbi:MAG: hypothetical protein AAF596_07360 [Planctomycetota bacterium]